MSPDRFRSLPLENPDRTITTESGYTLTRKPDISLATVLGEAITPRSDVVLYPEVYEGLGNTNLHVFTLTNPESQTKQYIAIASLNALETNVAMYAAAPTKLRRAGLDTDEIIKHSIVLYDDRLPYFAAVQKAHSKIPGWKQYEKNERIPDATPGDNYDTPILKVPRFLLRNWDFNNPSVEMNMNPNDLIHPVICWEDTPEGEPRIILDPLQPEIVSAIAKELPHINHDELSLGLGLTVLAAVTQTLDLPEKDGYQPKDSDENTHRRTNEISPVQIIPYLFRKVIEAQTSDIPDNQNLQLSPLLRTLHTYAKTGKNLQYT